MISKSPKDRVVGPLPNGLSMANKNMGVILTTYNSWDDSPSSLYWSSKSEDSQGLPKKFHQKQPTDTTLEALENR